MEEPFGQRQIGSSAMRAVRIRKTTCYAIKWDVNPGMTDGVQWVERNLDDSANKRICVAEAFLAVDAIGRKLRENPAAQ